MNDKILTLCTSAYNAEKYISKMIESVLMIKNLSLLQLIIVNDGSTDKTQEVLQYYLLKYPDIIDSIESSNGGSGAGRNKAFKLAKGKYIGLLDADDYIIAENLDSFIEYLCNTDADVIYNSFYKYFTSNDKYEYIRHINSDKHMGETLIFRDNYPEFTNNDRQEMQGTVYKNDLFINNHFELMEGISYVDAEFVTTPYKWVNSYSSVDFPYYVYCIGIPGQSVDNNVSIKKNNHRKVLIDKLLSDYTTCDQLDLPQSIKERMEKNIAKLYMDYINNFLYACDFKYKDIVLKEIDNMKASYPKIYARTNIGGRMKSVNYFRNLGYAICVLYGRINKGSVKK